MNNTSTNNAADGLYLGSGGILYMKNSLLANQPEDDFTNSGGTIYDDGYNLVENSSTYTWAGTGDITGDQAALNISGSLADNSTVYGTQTLALLTGSVAINAGNSTANNGVAITTRDQRGLYRTNTVDIGAFEFEASTSPVYTLTYSAGTGGALTGTTSQTVASGSDGTEVTAVPNTGYHFVNWSDSVATTARTDTNVTDDISVTASFAINTYTLEYTAGENGSLSGTSSQTVNYGSDGSAIEAIPDSNYAFVKWSDDSVENPRTDIDVTENISVSASFEIIDSDAPTKTTFVINDDNEYTNLQDVTLTIAAADSQNDVAYMMISNSVLFTGASWVAYATEYDWELTGEDGEKNVYIKFKDAVGNESLTYSDSILLDTEVADVTEESEDAESDFTVTDEGKRETTNQKPEFSGTGEPGATVTITINSDPIIGSTTVGDNGTWTWTPDENIPLGEHTVTIIVEDPAGNTEQVGYVLGVLDDALADAGSGILGMFLLGVLFLLSSLSHKREIILNLI